MFLDFIPSSINFLYTWSTFFKLILLVLHTFFLDFQILEKKVEQICHINHLWEGPTLNLAKVQREDRIRENFSEMEI